MIVLVLVLVLVRVRGCSQGKGSKGRWFGFRESRGVLLRRRNRRTRRCRGRWGWRCCWLVRLCRGCPSWKFKIGRLVVNHAEIEMLWCLASGGFISLLDERGSVRTILWCPAQRAPGERAWRSRCLPWLLKEFSLKVFNDRNWIWMLITKAVNCAYGKEGLIDL